MWTSLSTRCMLSATRKIMTTTATTTTIGTNALITTINTTRNVSSRSQIYTTPIAYLTQCNMFSTPTSSSSTAYTKLSYSTSSTQQQQQTQATTATATNSAQDITDLLKNTQNEINHKRLTTSALDSLLKEVAQTAREQQLVQNFSLKGVELSGRAVYLDMQATTPMDPRVLDAMMPFYTEKYGNPHSRTHHYGWETEMASELARKHVSTLIGADPKEIIFTSGATESNNTIIKGIAHFYKAKKKHIITTQTEHKCVLDSCRQLQQEGFEVTYLPVQKNGLVDLQQLEAAIRPDTVLISVMFVNNEIGVIQPMKEIGALCRKHKVFFHTDAAQALGKVPIDVNAMNLDAISMSGHKIYGPKGIGAFYLRRKPRVRLEAIMSGGGQERGMRSGTLPTPLVVGFGEACRVAAEEMDADRTHVAALSKRLHEGITSQVKYVQLNGDPECRYPGNLNLSFAYVEGESLLMALKEVAVSSGSACTSASLEPSYVLRALGVDEDMAHTSIRFGMGRFTTPEEVDFAVKLCVKHVQRLREMSPLYEMAEEGIDLKSIQWTN